jgi:nucleoside-diphosphate-sugar epimerase
MSISADIEDDVNSGDGVSASLLLTGVTGFVGRFVLHRLLESGVDPRTLYLIIRATGKRTAIQRFQQEILHASLFAPWAEALQGCHIIDAALENIEATTLILDHVDTLIHCAANVRHYDPYADLERDNVDNVRRILRLAETLSVKRLLLLSTCYVHPKKATERPVVRIIGGDKPLKREDFYNDYCYTKWLGEETVWNMKTNIPYIGILRLSCVGAPVRWDLAAHPCAAQAHLGILTLALRGYLRALATRPTSRISVIPVDIAATAIVEAALGVHGELHEDLHDEDGNAAVEIQQLAPPPALDAYHLSLPLAVHQLQLDGFVHRSTVDSGGGTPLPWSQQLLLLATAKGRAALDLHNKVQDFVSTFSDGDIRFASSLPADRWPAMTDQQMAAETCAYAARIHQHRGLTSSAGVPMSMLDRFWHRVGGGEPVQVCLTLKEPWTAEAWPEKRRAIWSVFMRHRKCAAEPNNVDALGPHSASWTCSESLRLDTYVGSPLHLPVDSPASLLGKGLQTSPPEGLWHVQPICGDQDSTNITHLLLRGDHGLADGVGAMPLLRDLEQFVLGNPRPSAPTPSAPRRLPWWLDLWMGLVYVVLLVTVWYTKVDTPTTNTRSNVPTLATESLDGGGSGGSGGTTFTSRLLWKVTHALAATTRRDDFVLAVPAVTTLDRHPSELLTNAFVPILLPVNVRMTEADFHYRCRFLHARSVRFVSWCLTQLVERMGWEHLQDHLMARVDAVVSSIAGGDTSLSGCHVATSTPAPVPFSVVAFTTGNQTHYTVRSHDKQVGAATVLAQMKTG